ncbi:carboxymuconolactone decarboxylase family protein [Curtobacterium flaccumfaciens]|uniref:carboxymuconolactone decarboxylase family protein n=1 Tax=Curtobacterium flaccumfaciens TaxID=2035 RepID=UPI003F80FDA7
MTFADTDPEFARYHADFVDETLRNASLSEHDRVVVQLGATIAAGAPTAFRDLLEAALDGPLSPTEAKEIVYQAVAYVGSARVGDFLSITNAVLVARGVALPLPGRSTTTPADRLERGRAVQGSVGADRVDAMYENAPADAVHFQRFLSGNCFGDTVGRDGLSLPTLNS